MSAPQSRAAHPGDATPRAGRAVADEDVRHEARTTRWAILDAEDGGLAHETLFFSQPAAELYRAGRSDQRLLTVARVVVLADRAAQATPAELAERSGAVFRATEELRERIAKLTMERDALERECATLREVEEDLREALRLTRLSLAASDARAHSAEKESATLREDAARLERVRERAAEINDDGRALMEAAVAWEMAARSDAVGFAAGTERARVACVNAREAFRRKLRDDCLPQIADVVLLARSAMVAAARAGRPAGEGDR